MEGQFTNIVQALYFLKTYMRVDGDVPASFKELTFSKEAIINEGKWAEEVNATGLCPNFVFCDTHSAGFESNGSQRRPDITAFALGESTDVLWDLITEVRLRTDSRDVFRDLFSRAALIIERKLASQDAFVDKDGIFTVEKPTQTSEIVRRQLIDYNLHHFSQQPRVSSIQLLLIHKYARLIWWDRASAVVTEAFDWTTGTIFAEFLYRFNLLSRKQRGIDTSVRRASNEEVESARNAFDGKNLPDLEAPYWVYPVSDTVDAPAAASDDSAATPTTTPNPPASPAGDTTTPAAEPVSDPVAKRHLRDFVVGRPVAPPRSFTGRNSTGFVAYDLKANDVAYLKDAWFPDDPDLVPEGDIYRKLQPKAGEQACPHIPTLVCAGQVCHEDGTLQETVSQDEFSEAERKRLRIRRYIRTRTVIREVGVPMAAFASVPNLLQLLSGTVDAVEYAYARQILHRDISAGNVMIKRDGHDDVACALLVDWDLALDMERAPPGARTHITGTWQFMSVPLLRPFLGHVHCVEDDLESTFWLLLYSLARYTDLHPLSDEAVMAWVKHYFDESLELQQEDSQHCEGGGLKVFLLISLESGNSRLLSPRYTHNALRTLLIGLAEKLLILHPVQELRGRVADGKKLRLTNEPNEAGIEDLKRNESRLESKERSLTSSPQDELTFEALKTAYDTCRKELRNRILGDVDGKAGATRIHDRYKKGEKDKAKKEQEQADKWAKEEERLSRAGLGHRA